MPQYLLDNGLMHMTTELSLREWRFGQTQAERLCAGVLSIEGFSAVDPQHPLGGPDGLKDVLCRRGLTPFVAAAYFPTGLVQFRDVKKKFEGDLKGVSKNGAAGFAFFVNQPLTVGQRKSLKELSGAPAHLTEVYHLERLRSVLDAPRGCGLRLEYLSISMTHEEQLAFWSSANIDIESKLARIEGLQLKTLQQLSESEDHILRRTSAMLTDLRSEPSSTLFPPQDGGVARGGPPTADLDVPVVTWLHRVLLQESKVPAALLGTLRTLAVSIAYGDGSSPVVPPPPEALRGLLSTWCAEWRSGYALLQAQDPDSRLFGIVAAYHRFLQIHPFTDGNGRVARALLDQMLRELLGSSLPVSFSNVQLEHQEALQHADAGDLNPLVELVQALVRG
jgi:hypothetical protein